MTELDFRCGYCGEVQNVDALAGNDGHVKICENCQHFLEMLELPAEESL